MVFDLATREFLFELTLPHLKMLEQNRSDKLTTLFAIISEFSDKYAYITIVGVTYHFLDTPNAFILSCTIYTALGVLSVLKSFNHEARPFFVMQLTPTKCWLEYGNPSGHSITSVSLYLTMWWLMCKRHKVSFFVMKVSLAATLIVCFAVAFSRIYHGVHTYNQILAGWALGVFLHVMFCHVLYEDLRNFVKTAHKSTFAELVFNKGTAVFYVIVMLAVLNFLFGNHFHPVPAEWPKHIEHNC